MILQIDNKEWCLLQDAVSGIADRHPYEERNKMTKKLSQIFNEQCHRQEDTQHADEASSRRS